VPAANVQNWNIPNINSIRDLVYNPSQLTIGVNPDILENMPDATPYSESSHRFNFFKYREKKKFP
jgi:protein involved in temperature-dependent protein secretion